MTRNVRLVAPRAAPSDGDFHPYERRRTDPRLTRAVQALLAINVAMLFLQWTVVSDADAFAVLGFQAGSLQRTLWSALTYMFVHYDVWHLALNMYVLLAFGPRLETAMGTRAFTLLLSVVRTGRRGGAHAVRAHGTARRARRPGVLGVMFAYWQQWPDEKVVAVRRDPDAPVDGARAVGRRDARARCDGRGRHQWRGERRSPISRTSAGSRSHGSTCGGRETKHCALECHADPDTQRLAKHCSRAGRKCSGWHSRPRPGR